MANTMMTNNQHKVWRQFLFSFLHLVQECDSQVCSLSQPSTFSETPENRTFQSNSLMFQLLHINRSSIADGKEHLVQQVNPDHSRRPNHIKLSRSQHIDAPDSYDAPFLSFKQPFSFSLLQGFLSNNLSVWKISPIIILLQGVPVSEEEQLCPAVKVFPTCTEQKKNNHKIK